MNIESNPPAKSPRAAIIFLGALALFQIIRITAFFMIQDVLSGKTPDAWLFPAMTDVFIGAMALFVAIGLWKGKGLAVWVSAIVFFCISISDHLDAITVVLTTKGPLPAMMNGAPSSTATMLAVMSLVEAFAIWALTRKSLKAHYLAPKTNPTP
ncbi:MAG: hypothetical protein HYZ49_03085 [Chloroflexi bacterium]|nr:hypothetical protein [Chloroflexota bacterium]